MKKKITILLIIAVFLICVARQPDEFTVERSVTISAPASDIFEEINNQHKWQDWSPWTKLDPDANYTFEGPDEGIGSITKWSGNMSIGEGSSTITESRANEFIKFKLEFIKPMRATDTAEFTFKPQGNQTIVTWKMDGKNNFMGKFMNMVLNCEKMVGKQFDQGLANLKAVVEEKEEQ